MIALKFGGTSVANAENINKTINIVAEKSKSKKLAVVVSAFSGVTDLLILAGKTAGAKDKGYKDIVSQIEKKHIATAIQYRKALAGEAGSQSPVAHHPTHNP